MVIILLFSIRTAKIAKFWIFHNEPENYFRRRPGFMQAWLLAGRALELNFTF
jgi:hypothetical protein